MQRLRSFDSTALAFTRWGPPGAPAVVLVHGLGLSTKSWGRVPELLAGEHRVLGYDLRGHGESANATTGDYGLSSHARDLGAVLDAALGPGERAVVVGHSLGGGIILAHAEQFGTARMAGSVFVGSGGSAITLPGLPPPKGLRWAQKPLRTMWLQILRAAAHLGRRARGREATDWLVRRVSFGPDASADAVRHVREHFLGSRPEVLAETTRASGAHNGIRFAAAMDVPTVVVRGEQDPQVSAEHVRRLVATLPRGELVSLPGAGHMLPLTRPEAVAEHVARWVREVRAVGA